jgi:Ca2+-binding RTX toxin-like protein
MYLTGTEGDDILVGTADADTILGLGGNDSLQGGDGDDLLIGGPGNDTLDGGAGSDTVSYEDAGPPPMFGFLMINLLGQYTSYIGPVGAPLDTLVSIENAIGSDYNDWFVSGTSDNQMFGGAGDDRFDGKGGSDVMDGGDGNDSLNTVGIFGAAAPGSLMIGGAGADVIQSGNSHDTMLGGVGNDYLSVENFAVTRIVDGGADTDTLAFVDTTSSSFSAGVVVDLNKTTQTVATGVVLTITGVENLTGSAVADVLIGDTNANRLSGGLGDDALYGHDGEDWLEGGEGNNTLDGGAGIDTALYSTTGATTTSVSLRTGFATFVTANGTFTDTLVGIENVIGTNGADVIEGDAGANALRGGGGADILTGGQGQDALDGDFGADIFVFADGDSIVAAPDTIAFFVSEDRIRFVDGPAGSTANYAELEAPDPVALASLFAGEGVRYVAVQSGMDVLLYADLGEEGTSYDQLIVLTGSHVMGIDAGSILGL